jgi:ATP-dependent helicase YprA (DUF1998 family)
MGKRRAKRGDTGRPGFYDEKGNFVELDWGADEKPKMDPAKVKQIGITAGLGVVLVSALVMFAMTDHTPKRKQTLVKQEKVEPKYQIGRKAVVDTTHVQTALTFSTDILKINKLVYESIRLILESGAVVDKSTFAQVDLSKVKIIEILVKSRGWDALSSDGRVDLLYQTYRTLKNSYPDISRVVRLVSNDKRNQLDFEFDKMFT